MGKKCSQKSIKIKISLWIILSLLIIIGSSIIITATMKSSEASFPISHRSLQSTIIANVGSTPLATTTDTPAISQTPTPLFYEDFTDNARGWALTDSPDFTRTLEDNELILAVINHNILTETIPASTTFADCTININFTMLKADANDSVGVYVRGDGLLFHDYRIDIFGDNTLALSKEYLDLNKKPQTLEFERTARISVLAAIKKSNILTIMMKGPYVMVQINGTTIKTLVDAEYTRGQVALFVNNGPTSDGVMAAFNNVKITEAPDQLPGLPQSPTVTAVATQ